MKIKKTDEIWAFLICSLAMFLVCLLSMGQFEEQSTLVAGDTLEIYVPALRSFVRSFWSGEGLSYSWNLFLGMNDIGYYAIYAGGSIVNLLWILYPQMTAETFVLWSLVLKAGLTGAFFTLFSKRVLKVEPLISVMFSIFYALCGFQVAINTLNYIWMDAVYLLPLLLFFVVEFVECKKWLGMTLCYAYLFFSNFYMGYIVGFFSLLYLVLYLCLMKKDKKLLVRFPFYVMLAAGLMAFVLVPSAMFILTKNPVDATDTETLSGNVFLLVSRFAFGISFDSVVKQPYLYCGIPVALLIIAYFIDSRIEHRERVLYTILLVFMLLSCMIFPMYLFWHGFDVPDGWYHRFAFIISFLGVSIGCKEAGIVFAGDRTSSVNKKKYMVFTILPCLLLALNCRLQYRHVDQKLWIWNLIIALGWTLYAGLYIVVQDKIRGIWLAFGFIFAFFEVVTNGLLEHKIFEAREPQQVLEAEVESALELLGQDQSFYRVNCENSFMINADTNWGFKGISDFGTYENYETRVALEKLGAYTSPRVMRSFGLNSFTQLLLNVKYTIVTSGSGSKQYMGAIVAPYGQYLELGFLVDQQILNYTFPGEQICENTNSLASAMIGQEVEIFTRIPEEKVHVLEEGIHLGQEEDWYYLQGEEGNMGIMQVTFEIPYEGEDAYAVFHGHNKGIRMDAAQLYEPYKANERGTFGVAYSNPMELWGDNLVCAIAMQRGITRDYVTFKNAEFFSTNRNGLQVFYDQVSQNQLEIIDYKNGYVHGKIKVPTTGQILFTSIPYDRGWKLKGRDGEILPLLDGAFLGIRFKEPGEHEIYLSYQAPGRKIGEICSLISLLVLGYMIYRQNSKRDKTIVEEQ